VVQEKYRGSSLDGVWKLPTGFILAVRKFTVLSKAVRHGVCTYSFSVTEISSCRSLRKSTRGPAER
jgi:hypothetical protein